MQIALRAEQDGGRTLQTITFRRETGRGTPYVPLRTRPSARFLPSGRVMTKSTWGCNTYQGCNVNVYTS